MERRKELPDEVPMPRVPPEPCARVLERLELQALLGEADSPAILEQPRAVGGDEMCHATPLPHVAVEPEAAVHGVDHPVAALLEFAVRGG